MKLKVYTIIYGLLIAASMYSQDTSKSIRKIEDLFTPEKMADNIVIQRQGPTGQVYGKVTDDNDEAMSFAQVIIVEDYEGITVTSKGTKCNLNGEYELKGLAPGYYNLMFRGLGKEKLIETRVEVKADNRTLLNTKLSPSIRRGCLTMCCFGSPRLKNDRIEKAIVEKKEDLFHFYPNPCRGNLIVEPPKNAYLLEIYDLKGKKIYINDLKEAKAKIEIDLNPYLNGIYFIICTASGNKKFYEKLELQK
jgi:hypothetical protein